MREFLSGSGKNVQNSKHFDLTLAQYHRKELLGPNRDEASVTVLSPQFMKKTLSDVPDEHEGGKEVMGGLTAIKIDRLDMTTPGFNSQPEHGLKQEENFGFGENRCMYAQSERSESSFGSEDFFGKDYSKLTENQIKLLHELRSESGMRQFEERQERRQKDLKKHQKHLNENMIAKWRARVTRNNVMASKTKSSDGDNKEDVQTNKSDLLLPELDHRIGLLLDALFEYWKGPRGYIPIESFYKNMTMFGLAPD